MKNTRPQTLEEWLKQDERIFYLLPTDKAQEFARAVAEATLEATRVKGLEVSEVAENRVKKWLKK